MTDLFALFTRPLDTLGTRYFVTGSVAGILYGEPRMTHDVDLVLALGRNELTAFCDAFPLEEFYCPPEDVIRTEVQRASRGHFNLIHHKTGFKADIYLRSGALHDWAFSNRREIEVGDYSLWVAPPEYVIVRKLEYYREGKSEKHLRDIAAMLAVSGDTLDYTWLEAQIALSGCGGEWLLAGACQVG